MVFPPYHAPLEETAEQPMSVIWDFAAVPGTNGSHRQFKYPSFQGIVTVSGGEGDEAKSD